MKQYVKANFLIPIIIILFSLTGLWSSFALSIDKLHVLENADIELPCSFNSVVDCKSVMESWQADILGFPNSFIGLMGYGMTLTFGASLLFVQIKNKWYSILANVGALIAFVFSYWLLQQSVYELDSLCPYCLISWFSANMIFFAISVFNIENKFIPLIKNIETKEVKNKFRTYVVSGIIVLFSIVFALVYLEFGNAMFA